MKRHRRRRRGIALMMVVIYTTLVLSAWSLANRQTLDLLRLRDGLAEQFDDLRGEDTDPDNLDPRLSELARLLAQIEQEGVPIGLPAGLPAARKFEVDPSYVLEYTSPDSVAVRSGLEWDALVAADADGSDPDHRRQAISEGLDLLSGWSPTNPACKVDPDAIGTSFAVEFIDLGGGGTERWAVAAYTQEEWDSNDKTPDWVDLPPFPPE